MVQFYLRLVKAGKIDIEDVPVKYKDAVRALLKEVN